MLMLPAHHLSARCPRPLLPCRRARSSLPCCRAGRSPLRPAPCPPFLCCAAQVGQLSIPTLPSNYRTTADQLSYIQMDFP